jgi:hypothetical protein
VNDQYRDGRSGARWLVLYLIGALALLVGACYWSVAHAQERAATITLTAPTHFTDGTPIPAGTAITYRVFQGGRGGNKTMIGTITDTETVINSGLERGQEYCWHVTVMVGNEESDPSNEGCKAFRVPTTVTITVT